jgi:hypothetical protein
LKVRIRFATAALLAAGIPSAVLADTITQTVPFDYDANFGATLPVIEGFDTRGGTRQLTRATFEFRNNFNLELFLESTGPTVVADGDFVLSSSYNILFQLGTAGDKGDPPPPLFGMGSFFVGDISGDLAAYDDVPGNDGPDSFRRNFTDAFTSVQSVGLDEPEILAAVTDVGPLTTVLGGFNELFFAWINDPGWPIPPGGFPEYPTDAAVWVSTPTFRHFGEIEITYEFVPEPTSAALLAPLTLFMRRRRSIY